jgi:threonine dehydratase
MSGPRFGSKEVKNEVELADELIRECVRVTPLTRSPMLSNKTGSKVSLKLENTQITGSFKARGAFSKLLSLDKAQRAAGVVTASTGNHALAMVYAMNLLEIGGEIWISDKASPAKVELLRSRGASLRVVDSDPGGVEGLARAEADRTGRIYVSPYNDPQVIGGQGTVAAELLRQHFSLDAVFVPVGGGGLMSGIAGFLNEMEPNLKVIGCQPGVSPIMADSVKAGQLIEMPWAPTLSDATAGLIEPDSITFSVCANCVDEWVLVSEQEIAEAVRLVMGEHALLVEGAGALAVAGFLKTHQRWEGKNVALVLSGARISLPDLETVLRMGHA